MIKLNNELINKIKLMQGNVICFGIEDEKIINALNKNTSILNCDLLNSKNFSKEKSKSKKKTLPLKKIRKKYKKKKNNFIVANINEIYKYKKNFVKDSIYINKDKIYLYTNKNNYEDLINMYKRYNTKIDIIKCIEGYIITIDTSKAKTNKLKDLIYIIIDTLIDFYNLIGDILIS